MNRNQIVRRIRNHTRDLGASIFREEDLLGYIDEAIDRLMQVVPELEGMKYLDGGEDIPRLLPVPYHHLIATYAVSRAYQQDERHYQATTFMNEFETKLEEMHMKIQGGDLKIKDENGLIVEKTFDVEYVVDNYFDKRRVEEPFDLGGVEEEEDGTTTTDDEEEVLVTIDGGTFEEETTDGITVIVNGGSF